MSKVVKKTTTKVANTLKKGEIAIGVNNTNYGPTASTGFYSGVKAPDSGYAVYKSDPGGVAAYAPANDTELLRVLNHLGANSANITAALVWAANRSDVSITGKSYDNFVTDNLVLNLDARYINSYPKSGSNWYDINGDPNNCALYNSPTYNSNEFLQFDGVNDYGTITNTSALQITGDQTLEFVVYPRRNDRRQNWYDKAYGGEGTITYEIGGALSYYYGTAGSNTTPYQGFSSAGSPLATLNKWYHVVLVRDLSSPTKTLKWYVNGILNNSGSANYAAATAGSANITIGNGYTTYFGGDIQIVRIYNKALTQAEVLRNYYRSPIVTDGLVFALSPSNILSYDRVGTTANSLVGTGTATLVNGVGLQNINKGVWYFDNTNDYIQLPDNLGYSTNRLSVFAWFRSLGRPAGDYHIISGGEQLEISIPWSSGQLRTGVSTGTRFVSNHGTTNLNDGKWHHIGFTFDGTTKRSYINGVDVGTQSVTGTLITSFTNRFIGKFGSSSVYYANGYIGGYLVYNKVLTPLEVKQNFDAQAQKFI
jgi:hypothetical protein